MFFRILYWIVLVSITLDAIGEVSTSGPKSEVDILGLNAFFFFWIQVLQAYTWWLAMGEGEGEGEGKQVSVART